jgi:hypothetical protein
MVLIVLYQIMMSLLYFYMQKYIKIKIQVSRIHPIVSSENIQNIKQSNTTVFLLKATCFGLDIDHHQAKIHNLK